MPRLELSADSLEEAAAILRRRYTVRIDVRGPNPGLRMVQDSLGGVELSRIRYSMDFALTSDQPMAGTFIARLRTGAIGYRFGRQENRWTAGEVFVAAPTGATLDATVQACALDLALIDPATFAAVARTANGTPAAITGYRPVSAAAARTWLATLDFACRTAARPDVAPLVAGATSRLVAAAALAAFPHDGLTDPTAQDRADAHPATVRRAVAHIESHPDRDLTVADIAGAAYVTPRALQAAFRRHLDTTPMRYLRRVRLDRAHDELLAAAPGDTTVTAVAARWGYARPGRFAADYRAVHGTSPSQTLHR